ncbi:MAG: FGGY-family carbohydrate kinase [Lachnoclostridium edouardi]|uniref:FGGY-family carbohydrate kinase n=1 Tax=Lachnoclostridium edouardi TaxID=1926283 RepID=UPI0026DCC2B4|nr:FGGY-family carbohydrate kinase [Lachnoclostridium edouardi]MDO4279734.1 FGGY-family carbohydrate kinase [Lachnoclostridium edouardi]
MKICSVDVGTTGMKVIIFDESGLALASGFQEYEIIYSKKGWAEQDGEKVFGILVNLLGKCLSDSKLDVLDGIVLSVQGDAVIPVDKDSKPLSLALLGMDKRSFLQAQNCGEKLGSFFIFSRTGMRPHSINSATKIMWFQENRKDLHKAVKKYLTYEGFLMKCLGADQYVTDLTMASRSMICHLGTDQWDENMLEALHISKEQLPHIKPSGFVAGRMSSSLGEQLHLKKLPLLILGGHDQVCAGIGAGAVRPGIAVDSHGTAEVLSACFNQVPCDNQKLLKMHHNFYPCYRHGVPEKYFTFALNHCGGISFQWFRNMLAETEMKDALETGRKAYDIIIEKMEDKATDLFFFPYFTGSGSPFCHEFMKGSLLGMTLHTKKSEIARSILEGLAMEMKRNLMEFLDIGIPVEEIRCVGGGASHKVSLQLKADVYGQPVISMKNKEAAALGAAIIGFTTLKAYSTIEDCVNQLVKIDTTYMPRPEASQIYKEKFLQYSNMYQFLQAAYKSGERT